MKFDQLFPGHSDAYWGLRVWGLGPAAVTPRSRRFVDCFKRRFQPNTNLEQRIIILESFQWKRGKLRRRKLQTKPILRWAIENSMLLEELIEFLICLFKGVSATPRNFLLSIKYRRIP